MKPSCRSTAKATGSKQQSRELLGQVLRSMQSLANPANVAGMARFGIQAKKVYGLSTPQLRKIGREIGRDHALAQVLWATGIHEARALATLVDDPAQVTERQMGKWVRDFDNWAICDGACLNLFRWTPVAHRKCFEWSRRPEEFVKRTAFSLMAGLAVAYKRAPDESFLAFLPVIEREATDERNFVKKAANWALRQIGKRNLALNKAAISAAQRIRKLDSRSARWIASDALRELESPAVQKRLNSQVHRRPSQRTMRPRPAAE